MRHTMMITALFFVLTACDRDELVGCTNNTQCPVGHICAGGRCRTVCSTDADCSRGSICVDSICEQGVRDNAPVVSGVVGNGSQSCADSPDLRCFADAIVVQGENLLGATFRLDNQGAGPSFDLNIGAQNENHQVELALPTDLAEGAYLLVAVNGAGSDQLDVQILQGEPGPALTGQEMLTTINNEATGSFRVARLPTSDDVITHINNGTIKIDPDLLPPEGGTSYDSNDIVGLVNGATINIHAERLGRDANDVIARINDGTDPIDTELLPAANDIITYLNTASGTVVLGTHIAPGGGGSGGSMTGPEIVAAINGSSSVIDTNNLNVGSGSTQVARGDHAHAAYAPASHDHAAGDITSGQLDIGRIPTGTTSSTVALGNHTHAGATRYTYGPVAPGAGVAVSQADINDACDDSDGCRIRIGYTGFGYWDGSAWRNPGGILWGPDCSAHTSGADWLVGYACGQTYTVTGGSYQPYRSDVFGTDGDGDSSFPRVLGYNAGGEWVCNLVENADAADNNTGYSFATRAAAVADYFELSSRRCYLVIED